MSDSLLERQVDGQDITRTGESSTPSEDYLALLAFSPKLASEKKYLHEHGLTWVIEIAQNSFRSGVSSKGEAWRRRLTLHYGYIQGSRRSADGEKVDFWMDPDGAGIELFFVVNQNKPGGGLDEHKVMVGFRSEAAARRGYLEQYPQGWQGLGSIQPMTLPDFKKWLRAGDLSKAALAE